MIKSISEMVTAFGSLLQGVAVAIGVFLAANEFIIKDREAERVRYATTLELVERDRQDEVTHARSAIIKATFNWGYLSRADRPPHPLDTLMALRPQMDILARHYTVLEHCLAAGLCDQKLLTTLTCSEATMIRVGLNADGDKNTFTAAFARIGPLESYVKRCPPVFYKEYPPLAKPKLQE